MPMSEKCKVKGSRKSTKGMDMFPMIPSKVYPSTPTCWKTRCEPCKKDKAMKPLSPKAKVGPIRAKQPLERIHCDLVGPIKSPTPGNQYQYLLVITDDYTRYMSAKPLKTKDETTKVLVEIVNILERAAEHPVKMIKPTGEADSATRTSRPNYVERNPVKRNST